jgi:hypothetical protein
MRAVVVEPPPPGQPRLNRAPLAVGAMDWLDPDPVATVIVKATYSFAGSALELTPAQRALQTANVANLEPDLWGELYYPLDFVPHKPEADVLVVGHAYAIGGAAREVPVRIAVGSMERSVIARAAAPADTIPLSRSCLFAANGDPLERVGPARLPATKGVRLLDAESDYTAFNAAPPAQRRDYFEPGETLRLSGLSPRGERVLELPRDWPRVRVSMRGVPGDMEARMVADTLWVDTDRELCVIVYRGMLPSPRAERVARIAVSLEPWREDAGVRSWARILRSAARGAIGMSATPEHESSAPLNDDERDRIAAARADLVLGEVPPEPALSLDDYARVGATLAEKREGRADVLARHGLDETAWMIEERAWLSTMAQQAQDGDGTLTAEYGEKFVAAQDALAEPHEAERTHADWAEIAAAIEAAPDVSKELGRRGLTLSEWMRLDRRVQRAAAADDAVADEIDALLEEARARVEAGVIEAPDDDEVPAMIAAVDDDGGDA